jgi:hypothetical protein
VRRRGCTGAPAPLARPQPEPDREDEGAVLVRARLPDGRSHTRRFQPAAPLSQVGASWVGWGGGGGRAVCVACDCGRRALCRGAPQVRGWLQSLEAFPLVAPAAWNLVTSFPRKVRLHAGGWRVLPRAGRQ